MVTNGKAPRDQRVSVRITAAGKAAITEKAQRTGLDESTIVRLALAHGLAHMPDPQRVVQL